jgi:hypothetical protein
MLRTLAVVRVVAHSMPVGFGLHTFRLLGVQDFFGATLITEVLEIDPNLLAVDIPLGLASLHTLRPSDMIFP